MGAMHASTKILLVLIAAVAIGAGWWIFFATNEDVPAIVYSAVWTVVVLIATRVLLALGSGYNRFRARRDPDPTARSEDSAAALARLTDLRDRELITPAEYEAKRAEILERL